MRADLLAALDEATAAATAGNALSPEKAGDLLLRILVAASDTPEVTNVLSDVAGGRALLRCTDAETAIEFRAGEGKLHAERADKRGAGPKVDASSATWIGLLGGTLRPWLAFTRGAVVCRAGISELRWMQQVAERLQRGYVDARAATSAS